MNKLAQLDQQYVWHPFTQMRDWMRAEPIVIASARGAVLRDVRGREFLDANSSIWTNLHGHNHPKINAAISRQLKKVAHTSALGLANEPASLLAHRLIEGANAGLSRHPKLTRVFFSDNGSTTLEVTLKLAHEFARRVRGIRKPGFLSLEGAYHGDTVGAVSLGHIDLFHKAYSPLLFKTDKVMSPYCYRCPFNKAKPQRADARNYRQCHWECVGKVEEKFSSQAKMGNPYAAFAFEPLMQGAAGMVAQPRGWLNRVSKIARAHGTLLIADEVMTGFGRAGQMDNLLASSLERVQPDFACLAKGITGGYLPMAATLTTRAVFDAFLGEYHEFKTFFHGHSYTANQLGASAALASLDLLQSKSSFRARQNLKKRMSEALQPLWALPNVGDIRQVGLTAGIELVKNWRTREPFDLRERAGIRVCEAMAGQGVLTRPIGNVIVLMPPYCTTPAQLEKMAGVMRKSIAEVLGKRMGNL
jgi:adenosylmethionine-8-amino-7-oxononanoate aminotransferase